MKPRYARSCEVLWRRAGDTVVMLSMDGGEVMELSGTGGALWELLAEPTGLDEAADALARRFGAPADVVAGDLRPLIRELIDRSLVSEVGGA